MILFGLLTGRDSHFPFIFLPVLHTKMDSGQQRQLIQCLVCLVGKERIFTHYPPERCIPQQVGMEQDRKSVV